MSELENNFRISRIKSLFPEQRDAISRCNLFHFRCFQSMKNYNASGSLSGGKVARVQAQVVADRYHLEDLGELVNLQFNK